MRATLGSPPARAAVAAAARVAARVARAACVVALGAAAVAHAQLAADDPLRARLRSLETDLRCLVCQNQTLADSDAPLAADLRREVRELAAAGRSDDEIRAYLVARYGDFVLYKPPVKPVTWLLWFGPFALLAVGVLAWWHVARRRARAADAATAPPIADEHAQTALQRAREALR